MVCEDEHMIIAPPPPPPPSINGAGLTAAREPAHHIWNVQVSVYYFQFTVQNGTRKNITEHFNI